MKRYNWLLAQAAIAIMLCAVGMESVTAQSSSHDTYKVESKRARVYTEWGVGVCGIYTAISSLSTDEVRLKPRFGVQGHLDMAVCFGRNFAIETEVSYEGGSIDVATDNIEHRVKTRTLDIPLFLSLRMLGGRIRIAAGPQFTVMSKGEYTEGGDVRLFGPISPTWNLAAGIGVGLSRHFILEARYIHALDDTHNQFGGKEGAPGIEFTTRPYRIMAGVTVFF